MEDLKAYAFSYDVSVSRDPGFERHMNPAALAQSLVDGFAALGLGAFAYGLVRRKPKLPLDHRLVFVFSAAGLLFAARSVAMATQIRFFETLSLIAAGLLPLGALIMAEGLMRRHAPRWLKAGVAMGTALVLMATLLGTRHFEPVFGWAFGLFMTSTLTAVLVLGLLRDRTSLSPQENATLAALLTGLAAIVPLVLSDFRAILPDLPIGFGPIGALLITYVATRGAGAAASRRVAFGELGLILGSALVASAGLVLLTGVEGWPGRVQLATVVLAALLATVLVLRLRDNAVGRRRRSFLDALARADGHSSAAFLGAVGAEPLLRGLVLADETLLADYDRSRLAAAFETRPILSRTMLQDPWLPLAADQQEELLDLFERTATTHAVFISDQPLRLVLVTMPVFGGIEDNEADLAVFQRLAALVAAQERR